MSREPALAALAVIAELGPGRIADDLVAEARALRTRIEERLALGDGLTVVALVGGTGVGTSALANRLAEASLATEGVRRPTTARPLAIVAPDAADEPVGRLLAWLGIEDGVTAPPGFPAGLVLLDLPDHDSVVAAHRAFAARLAERVDGLVVVVDPVKYARADLHHGPLAPLTEHAEVVLVVLNRIDELAPDDVDRCRRDLVARLEADGHTGMRVLTTSAATGAGVDELRAVLGALAGSRGAAHRRLMGDTVVLARRVADDLVGLPDPAPDTDRLLAALLDATDAHRVVAEAEVAYRRDARAAMRSPVARAAWLPVRGVTGIARSFGIGDAAPTRDAPPASPARIETVLAAELRLHEVAGAAHAALGHRLERLASEGAPALADAVGGVGVRPAPRRWWSALAALRGVAEVVTLAGLTWLVVLGVADWLQLPEIAAPRITEALAWPTALVLGGIVMRIVLGVVGRLSVAAGGRRHRKRTARAVHDRLRTVMETRLLAPYAEEHARHEQLRQAVATARGGG